MGIKTDVDKYKKKDPSLLQISVPFPSPPGVGLWFLQVPPPGGTRAEQEHKHKHQYKIKRNSWEQEKERQLGQRMKKNKEREKEEIVINTLYRDRNVKKKCNFFFRSLVIWSTSRSLTAQKPEYKHQQIRQLLHWFTCNPPLPAFFCFVFRKRTMHIWYDMMSLLAMPTPSKKHWFHNSCVLQR